MGEYPIPHSNIIETQSVLCGGRQNCTMALYCEV